MLKKYLLAVLSLFMLFAYCGGCIRAARAEAAPQSEDARGRIKIKALLLPKFEIGELQGDILGEAQLFYEAYLAESEAYDIKAGTPGSRMYVNRDGIALYVTGMGKINATLSVSAIMLDDRFDLSQSYIISVGCAGSAIEYCTMGDVVIGSATVDFDMGHHIDVREFKDKTSKVTWYEMEDTSHASCLILDAGLVDRVYGLVRDIELETTPLTRKIMSDAFDGQAWAVRDPKVLRGTIATADNYWKGIYGHNNAIAQCEAYKTPDPFAITEMEDHAIARVCERHGLLDRYIVIRVSVNTDVFMNGDSPEALWSRSFLDGVSKDDNAETADIFETAMRNNFSVGRVIIDKIINDEL